MTDHPDQPTTSQEVDALRSLMAHPGWRVYVTFVANVQQAVIGDLYQAIRDERWLDVKSCQKALDMIDKMLTLPDREITSAEAILAELREQGGTAHVR